MTGLKDKLLNNKLNTLAAIVGIVGLCAYTIYGMAYQYFDTVVFAATLLGSAFILFSPFVALRGAPLLDLLAVACLSYGVGLFFMNSFPVWADNLTGITMYASRGGLTPVIGILILLLLTIILSVAACFTKGDALQ